MSTNVLKLNDDAFRIWFEHDAILIRKGGYEFYEKLTKEETSQKITAFRCEDDITVFAVERINDKVKSIMAWRFCDTSILDKFGEPRKDSIEDMQLKFHELIEPQADCRLYIVGGMLWTTVGVGCLLDRIHHAIRGYFTRPQIEIEERVDRCQRQGYKYVTAKLEMNGKLTDCYHN